MNREIKFRVWDKNKKQMYLFGSPFIDSEYNRLCLSCDWNKYNLDYGDLHIEDEDLSIMQYTGLKDKNGKEIYEGDIFDCHYKDESKNHHKWQVVWNDDSARFSLKRIGEPCNQTMVSQKVSDYSGWRGEVIGNIHENPELLK